MEDENRTWRARLNIKVVEGVSIPSQRYLKHFQTGVEVIEPSRKPPNEGYERMEVPTYGRPGSGYD